MTQSPNTKYVLTFLSFLLSLFAPFSAPAISANFEKRRKIKEERERKRERERVRKREREREDRKPVEDREKERRRCEHIK